MLMLCGVLYMCLSIWAIIQMFIMGIMYKIEAVSLIESTEAEEFENLQDFFDKTGENYKANARNCFIAAGIYVLILLSTLLCISKAKENEKKRQAALLDDTLICTVVETELTEKQKKKIK